MKSRSPLTGLCLALIIGFAHGQTYDVSGQGSPPQNQESQGKEKEGKEKEKEQKQSPSEPVDSGSNLGWGSNIEVTRQARAAQDALKRNDYAAAVAFSERAAKSAPQNADLWFLLGYAARLEGHYPASADAYNRGLRLQPHSVSGLAGLAQTFARMGRTAEAEDLLRRVVEANPRDANSLQLAGELFLNSDPAKSLELLQRAEAIQPSAHSDLLIAHAYQRLGKPDDSNRYLNRAKTRAPNDPEVLRAVAGEYRDEGKYDQAISTLQAIPAKTPDTQAELAYTYQLAGKQQEAADLYTRLAQSAKGNIGLDLSAAQSWINLGQSDRAHPFLDDARHIDEKNYRLHALLAQVAESEDRLSDAAGEYKMALQTLPGNVIEGPLYPIELRLNLYELEARQDDQAAAKQQLESASAAINQAQVPDSSRPEMLRLRAAIESASGNTDAANQDLKQAIALAPSNVNSLLNYASLQWKLGQKDAARDTFARVLELDASNRTALSSLGYLARDKGDSNLAETYFTRAASAHPKDFAPYQALGDLYTSEGKFKPALSNYEHAYERMPGNPLIIAGAANAALESHDMELAKHWLDRSTDNMTASPQVNRERERYLTLKGEYAKSAELGFAVLQKLPNDREGVVYLAYDLYYLGRYDEALALVNKYDSVLANDKDLPLIAGYIHAHQGQSQEALQDFNRALDRDPKMATGYANRGFVLNDLRQAGQATKDFQTALQLQPNYGEAHLGLAYSDLQLHRPKPALAQLDASQKFLGKSHAWHLARAEAFRQEQDFVHAEPEYRKALDEIPNEVSTQLAYADTLYHMRKYEPALAALKAAEKLAPTNPSVYALRAQVHAKAGTREDALRDIQQAEQSGGDQVDILMATGDALLSLGDREAAMLRFSRALDAPNGDRIGVRLAVAQVFVRRGNFDDARRQLALGFAEARLDSSAVTADDILEAANTFLAMHDFDLAEAYFEKARLAGANPRGVQIGLANTYLAEGQTGKAGLVLAGMGPAAGFRDDYDYMMAAANLNRQRQDTVHALSDFAQASTIAGQEDRGAAQSAQFELAGEEGRQINQRVSLLPEGFFAPQFEDINVYTLDAKILHVTNPALLPPPRHSFQNLAETHYRIHLDHVPAISGFVGESITTGRLLFPSDNVIQNRQTYDTIINGGVTPVLHLGINTITFNGGLQFTVRRDTISPAAMSQNLFRQFLYVSTSSFFNWLSISGTAVREAGPFTDQALHSRDLSGSIEFTVGRPWGNTALLTGYRVRDLLFRPRVEEYFNTSSYIGLQHKFGSRLTAAILAEDLRSWRVHDTDYAIAQALLPGARFEFRANSRWQLQGSFLLSQGKGFHQYDNAQSEFDFTYMRPIHGNLKDGTGEVPVAYPFRVSVGVQQQTFYSFAGTAKTTVLPVIHFTLF